MDYESIICDANNLYRAYIASVKTSKWKERTQRFALNYLTHLFEIQNDLQNRTLENSPVTEFTLNERGRIRPIANLHIRDRIVRHDVCDEILMPAIRKKIIYDNCASVKGRGMAMQRKRFVVHLRKYYQLYGNDGYIMFGDFTKFYDNIIHDIAKRDLLEIVDNDEFISWLLTLIFQGFEIDVSYLSDEEYEKCLFTKFNKLEHWAIADDLKTGEKWMAKSMNIGDQLSQIVGIYYPHRIDNYVKYVCSEPFYGRYNDDWYIMNPSKERLLELYDSIREIASTYGIHLNDKKTRIVKISSTYKFLQVKYSLTKEGKVIQRINPQRVTAMRRKLKKLALLVEQGETDYESVENMFRSWMGGHYKLLSKQQRQNLITLFEDLFDKSIVICKKKLLVFDKTELNHMKEVLQHEAVAMEGCL